MSDRRFYVVVGSITLALAILGAILGTWWDEEYTLATTAHGAVYAYGRALSFELQAPLYFVLLALWRSIDSSVFFARLFSILCVAGVAFAAREIARRIRPGISPIPFVILTLANPFVVYAALEIRLYALALLLSAILWILFYDGYLTGSRPSARIWFVAVAIASIYVQYFLAFALVAGAVSLICARRYVALRSFIIACAVVGIAIAPTLWWAPGQAAAAYLGAASIPSIFAHTVQPVVAFALPRSYDWFGSWRWLVYLHLAAGLAAGAVSARFAVPRLERREWAILCVPLVMWSVFFLAATLLHIQYVLPRHFVGLFVPEFAALYVLVSRVAIDGRPKAAGAIAVVYALFAIATLVTTYRTLAKPGDWPRVGLYLSTHAQAGDRIAVFPARALPAFARSYHGPAEVRAFPRSENQQTYNEGSAGFMSASDAQAGLGRLVRGHRVWLVIGEDCADADPADGCNYLESAVAQGFPIAGGATFYLNRVVELSGLPKNLSQPRP